MKELFHPVLHFSPLVFTIALLEALFWCTCTISPTPLPPRANGELLLKKQTENLKAFSVGNQRLLEEKMNELSETKGASEMKLRHHQSQEQQYLAHALEQNHIDSVVEEPAASLSPLSLIVLTPIHEEDDPNSQKVPNVFKESTVQSDIKTAVGSSFSLPSVLTAVMLLLTSVFMSKGKEGKRGGVSSSQPHFAFLAIAALILFSSSPSSCVSAASQPQTPCGLNCWLQNLTIDLPPVEFHEAGVSATLSNGVCQSINIASLESSILSPSGLHVGLNGITVSCVIDYHFTFLKIPGSGRAYAAIEQSSWALDLQLHEGSDGLADSASVTRCDPKIKVSDDIHFTGGIAGFILNLFKGEIKKLIESQTPAPLCQEISTLVATNLTIVLQDLDAKLRPYMHPRPEPVLPVLPTDAISFRDNTVVALVDYLFNDLVGANGTLGLNKVAKYLTKNTGSFSMNNLKLNYTIPIPHTADLQVGLMGFNISGLDTWKTFQLFVPSGDYGLSSFTDLKTLNFSIEFFVNVSLTNGSVKGRSLYERALLVADLSNNQLNSTILLGLNGTALTSFILNQLLSPSCLLTTIEALNFTYLNFNFTVDQLALKAMGGDSEKQLDDLIDNLLQLLVQTFKLAAPAFFNSFISTPIQNFLNTEAGQLVKSHDKYVEPSETDEPTYNKLGLIVPLVVAVVVFIIVSIFIASRMRKKRESTLEQSLLEKVKKSQPTLCDGLVFSPKISNFYRYLVPFLLFVNVALFIGSNTAVGASVYMVLVFGQKHIQLPALFQFTLDNSVRDMWSAGVYPLSLLIACLSGGWPYLKILLMMFCWFSPIKYLSPKRREQVLMALDVLGKWGMIDAFVLTLMLVAFHFNIAAPVPPESLAAQTYMFAYVGPHYGIHGFILAAIVSLALTHILLHLHRTSNQKPETIKILDEDKHKSSLFTHAFRFHSSLNSVRVFLCLLVPVLICVSIGLLIVGAYTESFYFKFKGALGLVLNFLEGTSERHYSLLSLAHQLPGSFPNPNDFGVRLIQATLVAFAFAVPLVFLVSLLALWLIPLTFKQQKRLFIVTEILQAWSSLEVFIIAVIAALVELQQFAQFIIGDRCDLINKYMAEYLSAEVDEPKCFDVDAHLTKGCWLLFGSCLLYAVVGLIVTRTCHKALEEREEQFNLANTEDPPAPPSPIISDGEKYDVDDQHGVN